VGPSSFGPLLVSSSVAVALGRLILHGLGTRVLVPLVVTIVVADIATALALRLRISVLGGVGLGWAVSLWALALAVDPSLFDPASAHFLHAAELSRQLRAAQSALANDGTPLPRLNGMVGIVGAIGGLGAALTRGVWALQWRRSSRSDRGPLSPCLAPSFAIFIYSTLVSAEQGRVAAFVAYLLGVLVFVALADRAPAAPGVLAPAAPSAVTTAPQSPPQSPPQPPPQPPPAWRRYLAGLGALGGAVVLVVVAIAAGAGLSGVRLTVFHVSPAPAGAPQNSSTGLGLTVDRITGLTLLDQLRATEIAESHTVVFRARSPVTTYWQVGTLSTFNGTEWRPTSAISHALAGTTTPTAASLGSASLPAPTAQHAFTAKVAITDFVSHLLPAPPATTSVRGLAGASVIDQEGVLAPRASVAGTTYSVRAGFDTTVTADGPQLAESDPRLAPYLVLPAEPAIVEQLAHEAVGNATTPAAQAQDLIDWFRSGRFRYTLSPPATTGSNPLVQFLTVTKAGYCAQFAGAYGVLARTLGIPTRLVVGFTPGVAGPGDVFSVTGGDAHVWPQVYLGPDAGWVSVEPTPGTPAAEGVLGVAPAAPAKSSTSTPTTVVRRAPHRAASVHHHRARSHGGWIWWMAGVVVAAVLVLTPPVLWLVRRRRARHEVRLPPDQRVVRSWERALLALRRQGLDRRSEETPGEYATRVQQRQREAPDPLEADAVAHLAHLAALVELACYAPEPCTLDQAVEAGTLASSIVETNRRHRRRPRRRPTSHPTRV
jgi:transglutaminase-like putative cysteine protease